MAVRRARADAGKRPLRLPGLLLHDPLSAIVASLERVREKGDCPPSWSSLTARWWCADQCAWWQRWRPT